MSDRRLPQSDYSSKTWEDDCVPGDLAFIEACARGYDCDGPEHRAENQARLRLALRRLARSYHIPVTGQD